MDFTIDGSTAQLMLKSLPIGVVTTDAKGDITWANDAMLGLLGQRPAAGALTRETIEELLPFLEARNSFTILDQQTSHQIWLKHTVVDLAGNRAREVRAHLFEDVTEAKGFQQERDQLAETVRRQAPTDSLTGLLTQHSLMQGLQPLVSLSRRYDKPLSMVLFEIKNLDKFGTHTDDVVVATSRLLKEQMRWADMIARVSDNRFLLVLPETTKQAATKLVDKIYPLLCEMKVPASSLDLQVAFGITEWSKTDDVKRLISRSEEALNLARDDDSRYAEVI